MSAAGGGAGHSRTGRPGAADWAARAPNVPAAWFARPSTLHGVSHTQRVHIHAQRLAAELGWSPADVQLVLTAALWHDIGRTDDGVDPSHGAKSVARAVELSLPAGRAPADTDTVLFAMKWHSLPDARAEAAARRLAEPERALRILWLLKDADALDRVRLMPWEAADPAQLRHPQAAALIPFAGELFAVIP